MIFKPWDSKTKHQLKTFRLNPWGARGSRKKHLFDPVKVGRCDDSHTITKVRGGGGNL